MASTTHRGSTTTDEEHHLMDRTTDNAPEQAADADGLVFVDVYPRQRVNRRVLGLLFATGRLALAATLIWASVHYFQTEQIPIWLDANGGWYWFGAGACALLLLKETAEAITGLGDAWGCLRMTLWQARTARSLPPGERLRLISADELARVRTTWPPAPAGTRAEDQR